MKISELNEGVGRIVKGVNTTQDVGENEITVQAKKFGNIVDVDGKPPVIRSNKSNTLFNLGLVESSLCHTNEAVYSGNIGAMEVMKFFMKAKNSDIRLHEYVSRLSKSEQAADNKLAWSIIQNYLGVQLMGKEFGGDS